MNSKIRIKDKDIRNVICEKYKSNISICKLAKEYGVAESTINRLLRREGVPIRDHSHKYRKYTLNEDYFDSLNTPNKNYVLGLFYSDGCNYTKQNYSYISLQEKDKDLLEQIKVDMNMNKPLHVDLLSLKNPKWSNAYRMDIRNKKISSRLNELGVIPKKSLLLTFPDFVKEEFLRDFIRGYFDGDGCIYLKDKAIANIVGTESFCTKLQEILKNNDITSHIHNAPDKKSVTKVLFITGNKNVAKFIDYIYLGSELHLQRKYDKYLSVMKKYGK